jgi:chromosome segregation ATPase
MAQGRTGKPKSKGRAPAAAKKGQSVEVRLAAVERQREELTAELEVARQRITVLEAQRRQAVDRIDWVIDSLQHVVESGP